MLDRAASFGRFYDSSALDGVVSIGENSVTPALVPLALTSAGPQPRPVRGLAAHSCVRFCVHCDRACARELGVF